MPIYEYLCAKCETGFELRRPFSEADKPAICPKCDLQTQKLVSGFTCKTGSYIQASPKPFRKGITENVEKQAQLADLGGGMMKQGQLPRRRRYPRLFAEYEQHLRQREREGKIKEITRRTYLNDAHRVVESVVAALPAEDIEAKVGLLYRGYYRNIIKELKAIMERRP